MKVGVEKSRVLGPWSLEVPRVLELLLFANWRRKGCMWLLLLLTIRCWLSSRLIFKRNSRPLNSVLLDAICLLLMVKVTWKPSRRLLLISMYRSCAITLVLLPLVASLILPRAAIWPTTTLTSLPVSFWPTTSWTECSKRASVVWLPLLQVVLDSSPILWVLFTVSEFWKYHVKHWD